MVGGSTLRVFLNSPRKSSVVKALVTDHALVYFNGVLLSLSDLSHLRGFQDDALFQPAPPQPPRPQVPHPAIWTGSVSILSIIFSLSHNNADSRISSHRFSSLLSQLRLDSTDFNNLLSLRALYLHGQHYPPHLLAAPLVPSDTIEFKGTLAHTTLLDHLKASILSPRKDVVAVEITIVDDHHGLKMDAVKMARRNQ